MADSRAKGLEAFRDMMPGLIPDDVTSLADDGVAGELGELTIDHVFGALWTRPGLDRRSRSMITLTALIARGRDEELALHLRAALRNGLSRDEIKEVLLQTAVYCGVPDANAAFRIAQNVFEEADAQHDSPELGN